MIVIAHPTPDQQWAQQAGSNYYYYCSNYFTFLEATVMQIGSNYCPGSVITSNYWNYFTFLTKTVITVTSKVQLSPVHARLSVEIPSS